MRAAYAQLLTDRAGGRADCVAPEELLALVDGTAPEAERLRVLRHVGICRRCRDELDVLRLAADVASRVAARQVPWRALAAAAAVVIVAGGVLWQRAQRSDDDTLRTVTPPAAVRLLAPGEEAPATLPLTLVWSRVPGARRYQVEILTPEGTVAFAVAGADTTVVVPPTGGLTAGVDYRWWVRATLENGAQARSLARRLRLAIP